MFDVFMKFSDYSILVRTVVASWVIFTAIVVLIAIFARPLKNKDEQTIISNPSTATKAPVPGMEKQGTVGISISGRSKNNVFINPTVIGTDTAINLTGEAEGNKFINPNIKNSPSSRK